MRAGETLEPPRNRLSLRRQEGKDGDDFSCPQELKASETNNHLVTGHCDEGLESGKHGVSKPPPEVGRRLPGACGSRGELP